MATIDEVEAVNDQSGVPEADREVQEPSAETPSSLKRHPKPTPADDEDGGASRRSKRQRVATRQYDEGELEHKSKTTKVVGGRAAWKEEELEKLFNCLKKYQRTDNVQSMKKHVKTKNLEQVEAKIESLHKKALDRVIDETVGMPPLQCWETLAKDVTSTLSDESYKEISKVFWTAVKEPTVQSAKTNPNMPNYNEIYRYLAALLRDNHRPSGPLPDLSPIDAMVVLECLNNTVEFLQNLKMKDQSSFLQKRYEELFHKLNSIDFDKTNSVKSTASTSQRPDHSYGRDTNKPSTSRSSEKAEEDTIGLGTLNPFNIPVDKLNLLRPQPCSEHGNMYCWIQSCKETHKAQET